MIILQIAKMKTSQKDMATWNHAVGMTGRTKDVFIRGYEGVREEFGYRDASTNTK